MAKKKQIPKRILNCVPSRMTENDWRFGNAVAAGAIARVAALPVKVDLRESWWDVGDQGATGSCVGWATADTLLRWHFTKAARIKKSDHLSTRFTWMASKETDEFTTPATTFIEAAGTSLKSALDVARNYGAVLDEVLPFASGKLYPNDERTFYALAAQLKISSYFNLGSDTDAWKRWIAENGPILVRLDVDRTFDEAKSNGGNMDTYLPNTRRGGHAVALVGYTADRFIVRNSWGTTQWGDKGFGYASYSYAQTAFTEAYGVAI